MRIKSVWAVVSLAASVFTAGCSSPCADYCATFVERTQQCGLGGPAGDDAVDSCAEDVEEVLTEDACETADSRIASMSCADFEDLVCAQPGASQTYSCD